MAGYIGSVPVPQATETRDVYTATSNQTTFTTGGYTPNFVSVYLNGVHLARADYTATNGSDVVLAVGAAADDTVEIVSFATFEVSAQTFTGDVTASGGTFLPTGDTAAGDDAAVGYTAAEGLILTGQGTTNDVTIKNDADADVIEIPTGTVNVTMAGTLGVTGVITGGGLVVPDGSIAVADLDIDGATDIGAAIVDADLMIIDDGAGGTNRKATMSRLATYMGTKGLGPTYTRATTPPGSPNAGDWWLNTNANVSSIFIYDGTLGWIQGDGTALGVASYLSPNSFSLRVQASGFMDVIRFENPIPQIVSNAASYTDNTTHPVAMSNTVRGVLRVHDTSATNALEFIAFATLGRAASFGNTNTTPDDKAGGISHATRGIIAGGESYVNHMEYVTIGTEGNGTDFGDLTVARGNLAHACVASTTRGIILGGTTGSASNVMDYVTIANTGNATDFGNLTQSKFDVSSAHSTTRGIRIGGSSETNVMDYITMANAGNATDFGDLVSGSNTQYVHTVHNGTYAWIAQYGSGGDGNKQQITMATAANASAITDGSSPFGTELAGAINPSSQTAIVKGWIAATG